MDDQVAEDVKTERLQRLQAAIERNQAAFNQSCLGRTFNVLFERDGPPSRPACRPLALSAAGASHSTVIADRQHCRVSVTEISSNSLFGVLAHAPVQQPVFVGAGA